MKKHAYLIIAHNEMQTLKKLVLSLDDARNDIYIHLDKKATDIDEKEVLSWACKSSITLVPRIKVYWGTLSMAKCEMILLKAATEGNYHYYHLLSGVDFPLKSQDYIHDYLDDKDKEYISWHRDGENGDYFLYKLRYYYPFLKYIGSKAYNGTGIKKRLMNYLVRVQRKFDSFQRKINVNRLKKYGEYTFYKGDQWFSITHDFAKFLISQEKDIYKKYRLTNGCDEFFVPTIAMNSAFSTRVVNNSLREIDWTRGNPYEFSASDIDLLRSSEAFFARKISVENDPLLVKLLEEEIINS